jgi:hypothetical protein
LRPRQIEGRQNVPRATEIPEDDTPEAWRALYQGRRNDHAVTQCLHGINQHVDHADLAAALQVRVTQLLKIAARARGVRRVAGDIQGELTFAARDGG